MFHLNDPLSVYQKTNTLILNGHSNEMKTTQKCLCGRHAPFKCPYSTSFYPLFFPFYTRWFVTRSQVASRFHTESIPRFLLSLTLFFARAHLEPGTA